MNLIAIGVSAGFCTDQHHSITPWTKNPSHLKSSQVIPLSSPFIISTSDSWVSRRRRSKRAVPPNRSSPRFSMTAANRWPSATTPDRQSYTQTKTRTPKHGKHSYCAFPSKTLAWTFQTIDNYSHHTLNVTIMSGIHTVQSVPCFAKISPVLEEFQQSQQSCQTHHANKTQHGNHLEPCGTCVPMNKWSCWFLGFLILSDIISSQHNTCQNHINIT